jgi:hypothetical protein
MIINQQQSPFNQAAAARPEDPARHAAHGHALLKLLKEQQDKDGLSSEDKDGLRRSAVGALEKAVQLGPALASTASLAYAGLGDALDELGEVMMVMML